MPKEASGKHSVTPTPCHVTWAVSPSEPNILYLDIIKVLGRTQQHAHFSPFLKLDDGQNVLKTALVACLLTVEDLWSNCDLAGLY